MSFADLDNFFKNWEDGVHEEEKSYMYSSVLFIYFVAVELVCNHLDDTKVNFSLRSNRKNNKISWRPL